MFITTVHYNCLSQSIFTNNNYYCSEQGWYFTIITDELLHVWENIDHLVQGKREYILLTKMTIIKYWLASFVNPGQSQIFWETVFKHEVHKKNWAFFNQL